MLNHTMSKLDRVNSYFPSFTFNKWTLCIDVKHMHT